MCKEISNTIPNANDLRKATKQTIDANKESDLEKYYKIANIIVKDAVSDGRYCAYLPLPSSDSRKDIEDNLKSLGFSISYSRYNLAISWSKKKSTIKDIILFIIPTNHI